VKERLLKYSKYIGPVGYPLFYLFCLAVFASLTFPYRRLKERIVGDFNASQRASGGLQELQVDDMSGYWLSGVRMSGVTLLTAPADQGKALSRIDVDEATVRYSLLPLLIGHNDITFDMSAFGGEANGSYEIAGKDKTIDVALDSIDIGKLQPLADMLGLPLGGKLGGSVHLTMPDGKASKGSGQMSLEIQDVWIGDGKGKLKGAVALPKLDIGTVTLAADAKDGVLKITKFVAGGKDVEIQGDGRITMREVATDSLLDLQVRFRINDAYRVKNDMTKTLFGAPGSSGGLFEMADPKIKQSKRPDGFFAWVFRGPLNRPDFSPAAGAVGGMPMPTSKTP
jgi:type II secretion system protein N